MLRSGGGRDVVVVGASAGGVEALRTLVAGLSGDLPATVLVVLHLAEGSPSALAGILGRAGRLPVATAVGGEAIRPGTVRVAPAGHHLLLRDGRLQVTRGPRENGYRPAVDVLFRSAAEDAGPRVVAVVLSGALDDGTAGTAEVRSRGGLAVVQDPGDALYPGMPSNAIRGAGADHVVPLADLAPLVERLVRESVPDVAAPGPEPTPDAAADPAPAAPAATSPRSPAPATATAADAGGPGPFACPDCHGTLEPVEDAEVVRYRCRVGHAWSADSLLGQQAAEQERAMWAAVRSLRERQALARHLGERAAARGGRRSAARYLELSERAGHAADLLRRSLEQVQRAAGPAEP